MHLIAVKSSILMVRKLIAQKKIHTVEHLIFGEETYGNGYNLLSQGNNLTSNGFMNFNRSPGLLEPSSNITSKPSTLSKPSGHSKRKSYGKRGPRGDKKKGENPPVTPVPSNTIDGATPGERNTGLTTTTSTNLLGGNIHSGFVSLGSQDTGDCKVSTNLCFSSGSFAPCG
ncbi:hypothetical protein HPP92_005454 [Vanilla planifolia]|uniref:Uncharacterized protein n=1 Tax=Vanilla planifolia TaxID=51239 RepID=A0A835RU29_VANPL|nr:hypothetical protein HPP92_005454 [Vanilla planifolia]